MKNLNRTLPRIFLVLLVFTLNIAFDQVSKYFAVEVLKDKEPVSLLWNSIVLVYTENTGAFLSLGNHWPEFLKVVAFLVLPFLFCLVVMIYCMVKETNWIRNILLTSICAGGLGNLWDRTFHSFHVTDFLNFGIGNLRTGILNVADMSVTFGVFFLLFHEYLNNKKKNGLNGVEFGR